MTFPIQSRPFINHKSTLIYVNFEFTPVGHLRTLAKYFAKIQLEHIVGLVNYEAFRVMAFLEDRCLHSLHLAIRQLLSKLLWYNPRIL